MADNNNISVKHFVSFLKDDFGVIVPDRCVEAYDGSDLVSEIQDKLKILEYELKIWDDEFEGGGQLAKRVFMGRIDAYRDVLEMMGC